MEIIKESDLDPTLPKSTFFHVGQDKKSFSTCPNTCIYKSTVKKDYPAYGYITKQGRMPSPKPAKIFSIEARINEQKSLTSTHFVRKNAEPAALSGVAKLVLGTKNLTKMDIDGGSKSFETTHKVNFPARILEKLRGKEDRMRSYIPQGDKEKVRLPHSNYKQSYQEGQLSKLDVTYPVVSKPAPLLQGDTRSYDDQFQTTNQKIFGAHCTTPQKLHAIKNNGCSIRHGDPDKCKYAVTTNQKFFKVKPIDRAEPCGPNYVSSVVLGDYKSDWSLSNYKTNRLLSLPVAETQHLVAKMSKLSMLNSSVPVGDLDPDRAQKRITQTTNNSFLRKPVVEFPYSKVNGSNLLTRSKIKFGTESAIARSHYNATMKSDFPAKSESLTRSDWQTTNSNVCLDFYGNESNQSTTFSDFCQHNGAKRLLPNPESLAKLTDSHIQLPKALTSEFLTSHNTSYPLKQSKRQTHEPGRLHKSSIVLGNVSVH